MASTIDDDAFSIPSELQRLTLVDSNSTEQLFLVNSNTTDTHEELTSLSTANGYYGYKDIDWERFHGFQIPHPMGNTKWSLIWDYGYAIEETKSGKKYWLYLICHQAKSTKNYK